MYKFLFLITFIILHQDIAKAKKPDQIISTRSIYQITFPRLFLQKIRMILKL